MISCEREVEKRVAYLRITRVAPNRKLSTSSDKIPSMTPIRFK